MHVNQMLSAASTVRPSGCSYTSPTSKSSNTRPVHPGFTAICTTPFYFHGNRETIEATDLTEKNSLWRSYPSFLKCNHEDTKVLLLLPTPYSPVPYAPLLPTL